MDRDSAKFIRELQSQNKDKDVRLTGLETSEYSRIRMAHLTADIVPATLINIGTTLTSSDIRTLTSPLARGIIISLYLTATLDAAILLLLSSSDDTPNIYSPRFDFRSPGAGPVDSLLSQTFWIPLGADGKFKILNDASSTGAPTVVVVLNGWWE